ncbi:unnamed protein product [Gordionus sp. m RMFG-2023]|uniref:phosphatidylinositol N-acetylglucosaminyltransferase subunit A-like n=1 Tax=Gordionus sp. m RMFG-2023 TaxID=3053472 RepID=UPI0030E09410
MNHNICMVSDFFYPNSGGVENHIYQLSTFLIQQGYKVIAVTHGYEDRKGIRYLQNGLKIYYLPLIPFYNSCILPTLYSTTSLIRHILIREDISILHGHSAFSALALESIVHANLLNIKTVFTEHSLFGFADASSIITNQLLKITLCTCNHIICVSHTSKENTILRAYIKPEMISVIPNAIDSTIFVPRDLHEQINKTNINIIVMSRLVYRKGISMLVDIIPEICSLFPNVNFIIGGDGPKRLDLEEMKEKNQLDRQVSLLGKIEHDNVYEILTKGQIFLNTSLTEAFCIAILEAASCGLQVVSTKVGGIPEVLPQEYITLVDPNVKAITKGLINTIKKCQSNEQTSPIILHNTVKTCYSWDNIAQRTGKIYDNILQEKESTIYDKLKKYYMTGPICGKLFYLIILLDYILLWVCEYFYPKKYIDKSLKLKRYMP